VPLNIARHSHRQLEVKATFLSVPALFELIFQMKFPYSKSFCFNDPKSCYRPRTTPSPRHATTTFIMGGTGRTGRRLAKPLRESGIFSTRCLEVPEPLPAVKFDWFDPSMFDTPLNANTAQPVDRVFLIVHGLYNAAETLIPFAVTRGVNFKQSGERHCSSWEGARILVDVG